MILKIKNSFGLDCEVPNLNDATLIVGDNGVGKTRLLHAIACQLAGMRTHYAYPLYPRYEMVVPQDHVKPIWLNQRGQTEDTLSHFFCYWPTLVKSIMRQKALNSECLKWNFGAGFNTLIEIVRKIEILSLHSREQKVLLIDDLGTALNHNTSDSLIKFLLAKSKEYDIQIIATTNNKDIIDSFAEQARSEDYKYSMVAQIFRMCEIFNKISFVTYEGSELDHISNVECR